jgi:NAD(P)H dehydrogenase (quinone)
VFISPFGSSAQHSQSWIDACYLGFRFTHVRLARDIRGNPLLKHDKRSSHNDLQRIGYQAGLGEAMRRLIDEFTLHYPGIRTVEHEYFYAVNMADEKTLQGYLERAYLLGKEFTTVPAAAARTTPAFG